MAYYCLALANWGIIRIYPKRYQPIFFTNIYRKALFSWINSPQASSYKDVADRAKLHSWL